MPETCHKSDSHRNSKKGKREWFGRFASFCSTLVGSRWAFTGALTLIVAWAAVGPYYQYSDTWQLIINTGTTIVTFVMVFLIQNTQNRDARAINLKLDEIIRSISRAKNDLIDIEKLSDEELDKLASEYERIRQRSELRRQRKQDELEREIKDSVKREVKDELSARKAS